MTHSTAGTARFTLRNEDRRFDSLYTSSPYYGNIKLRMAVTVKATVNATDTTLFVGEVNSWVINYEGPYASSVTVTCTDGLQKLAAASLKNMTDGSGNKPPTFSEEISGTRVTNILNCYVATADGGGGSSEPLWPTGKRAITTGQTTVQAKETTANSWQELQKVAESELAQGLYVDRQGSLTFIDRHYTKAQATPAFSDDGTGIAYTSVVVILDDELLFNLTSLDRHDTLGVLGGVPETASDGTSQSAYGVSEFSRSGLLNTTDSIGTAEVQSMASYILGGYKEATPRFDRLTVNPHVLSDANQTALFGMDISDPITVERNATVDGASSAGILSSNIDTMLVDSISHRVSTGNKWQTQIAISPSTEITSDALRIDTGKIGTGTVGF